jgi:hypothetical protein
MKIESELVQKLKDKVFQTENDKKLIESFEIERENQLTAVEKLFNIWLNREYITEDEWLEAIEMEKERMIEFASYYTVMTKEELEIGFNHKFKQQEQ